MKKAFTLAEVLITLMIIGVVAAVSIPSVLVSTQQKQYKTGLSKALNSLNKAIQTNLAQDGTTPYNLKNIKFNASDWDVDGDGLTDIFDVSLLVNMQVGLHDTDSINASSYLQTPKLAEFLMKNMNIVKTGFIGGGCEEEEDGELELYGTGDANFAFYTADGMRFEVPLDVSASGNSAVKLKLYETDSSGRRISLKKDRPGVGSYNVGLTVDGGSYSTRCGSFGLTPNPNHTTEVPCVILVDVNADKKPNPGKKVYWSRNEKNNFTHNGYNVPAPEENQLSDIFTILITDRAALPYGVVAQRALYEADDGD